MPDYKAMYYALAAKVADAVDLLIKAQQDGEEGAMREDFVIDISLDGRAYEKEAEQSQ